MAVSRAQRQHGINKRALRLDLPPHTELSADGGIGRRAGLRIPWGDPSEFESRSAHAARHHGVFMPATELSVDVQRKPGSQVELKVEAPATEVDAAIDAALR